MLRRIMPSPAMAVALLALFVSLAGGAYAAANLPRNSVGTAQIRNGAVSNPKLANNAVGTAKIRNGAVTEAKLGNRSVSTAKLRTDAIRTFRVSASITVPAHTGAIKSVLCPSHGYVTGGGVHTPFTTAHINGSQPSGESNNHPDGWTGTIFNPENFAISGTVFAVCIAR